MQLKIVPFVTGLEHIKKIQNMIKKLILKHETYVKLRAILSPFIFVAREKK